MAGIDQAGTGSLLVALVQSVSQLVGNIGNRGLSLKALLLSTVTPAGEACDFPDKVPAKPGALESCWQATVEPVVFG